VGPNPHPSPLTPSSFSLWAPVVAYMGLLFVASSLSSIPSPPGGLTDKHEHFFFYGILAGLTLRALAKGEWRHVTLGAVLGAILISSAYGVSDEWHQRFVPGRDYELLDMAADAIGSTLAAGGLWAWSILRRRSETPDAL
jgi:VanZ family protein